MARTASDKTKPYPIRLKLQKIRLLEKRSTAKGFNHTASYVKWKLFVEADPIPPAAIVKLNQLREELMNISPLTAVRVDEILRLVT